MKKRISLVLALGMLLASFPAAAQEIRIDAFCDSQSRVVSVSITADEETAGPALVYLLDDNTEGFTPDMLTPENIAEKLVGIGETTYTDGANQASIRLPEALPSGWYVLTAADMFAEDDLGAVELQDRQVRLFYADEALVAETIAAVNGASETSIDQILARYQHVIGIDLSKDYNSTVGKAFLSLRNAEFSGKFPKLADLYNSYFPAQAAGMILSAETDKKAEAIAKYGAVIGLKLNEDYEKYKSDVAELMVKNAGDVTMQKDVCREIADLFNTSVALAALNNSNREEITKVLETYTDIFQLSTTSAVYRENTIEVNKALKGKGFTTVQAVRDAYNKRIGELSPGKPTSTPRPSGGGHSSSVGYVPPSSTPAPTPTVEPSENPGTDGGQYTDLAGAEWAQEAIYALTEKGIVAGYGDGSFKPSQNVKREEFIKMLVSALGLLDAAAEYDFTDGEAGAWYAPYVASAKAAGITSGYSDGSFGVGRELTREEMAAMAFRAAGLEAGDAGAEPFLDDDEIAEYAKTAVYTMRGAGVISGMDGGRFRPAACATRAQAARIIYLLIGGEAGA